MFSNVCPIVSNAFRIISQCTRTKKKKEEHGYFQLNENPKVVKWNTFNDKLYQSSKGAIPKPYECVNTLISEYLPSIKSTRPILDVGCETGKNAIPLIEAGHTVVLLDISPNALRYTQENLHKLNLSHGVVETINTSIEALDPKYGPFKAVIGAYAFSFIPPRLFDEVMAKNVLGRVERNGYFVGGFFGAQHSWSQNPKLSILTQEKLKTLFSSLGFTILRMEEKIEETPTVSEGKQIFHTIDVIAKRSVRGFEFFNYKLTI